MSQRPIAVGLVLCEKVVLEEGTRNPTLINCFHRRVVRSLPSEPVSFIVFTHLTNGQGEMPYLIRIERLDTLEVVDETEGTLRFSNPLAEVRIRVAMEDVSFPVSGLYDVVLLVDKEQIASRRIRIDLSSEDLP